MTYRLVPLRSREASQPPSSSSASERLAMVRELSHRAWSRDFRDIIAGFLQAEVRFLIVGAHALGIHGVPRATADLDIWIEPTPENAARVWRALLAFGAPVHGLGITESDLCSPDMVAQLGVPPYRIDLLTGVSGVTFGEAWAARIEEQFEDLRAPFIGRTEFVRNKRASGRTRDLADLEAMGEA